MLAEGGRRRRARGRRPARCPRASRSCRPTTTGRTSRRRCPGKQLSASQAPKVFVSTQPAELILLTGEPSYLAVAGHDAAAVGQQHRERRVPHGPDRRRLLPRRRAAGSRRRTSPDRGRSPRRRCRPTSRRSRSSTRARACSRRCPGTTQAAEAVLLAQIPQTARVNKKRCRRPRWPTRAHAAVPADREDHGAARGQHRQGHLQGRRPLLHVLPGRVVHVARRRPGPWDGHRRRCRRQIYEIPVSSPSHTVTYVTVVEDRTTTTVVLRDGGGVHRRDGGVGLRVWGTGYYYPPYVGYGGGYPYLLPALPDLRLSARRTTRGPAPTRAARSPTARTAAPASAQRYNPRTGTYSRGAAAYGPYGARGAAQAYNPRTGAYGARPARVRTSTAAGARPACSAATTGRATVAYTNNVTGNTTRVTETQRRRRGRQPPRHRRQHRRRPHRQRRRLRRPRRQRLPQAGRQLAEVRQRRLERRQPADAQSGVARLRRPHRRRQADARGKPDAKQRRLVALEQLPRQRRQPQRRQPRWRWRRRPAALTPRPLPITEHRRRRE